MWLPNYFLSNLGGTRTWRDHWGVERSSPGFHKEKKQVNLRNRGFWGLAWILARLQSKLEADGLWMLRKGSCDSWEPAQFKARISQAQLTSSYCWKRPLAWMLNLEDTWSKNFIVSLFVFFTSWKAMCYL